MDKTAQMIRLIKAIEANSAKLDALMLALSRVEEKLDRAQAERQAEAEKPTEKAGKK